MNAETEITVKKAIAACGPLFVIGYILCFGVLGHNIPPPQMVGITGEEFVASYYGRYPEIAVGMVGCAVVGLLYLPWSCLLASMLRDKQGNLGPLGLMELSGGLLTAWLLAFCPALWAACSLMVGSVDADVIHLLHMGTWIIYDCTFMITTVQLTGLGVYVILSKQTTFPVWTGWSAIAIGAGFLPLVLVPFVSEGPFAVNGVWNFYIIFGSWLFAFFVPFSYYMFKALSPNGEEARHIAQRRAMAA